MSTFDDVISIPYFDENGNLVEHLKYETIEQKQAWTYVPEDGIVLELGARYGTVSCLINHKIKLSGRQVSVEPDPKVLPALIKNKESHGCNFIIYDGIISKIDMTLQQDNYNGYGNTCVPSSSQGLKRISLEELIKSSGLKFDTLVADCEGFLEQFFDENRDYIPNFRIVIFERDYPYKCNYHKVESYLRELGFVCINQGSDMHVVYKNSNKV